MNLVQFLRLISHYARYILVLPLIPALVVILLTGSQPKEYKSTTLIYTGFASTSDDLSGGASRIDFYAVNNTFDNLINLITSREVLEKTGTALLARHIAERKNGSLDKELAEQLENIVPAGLLQSWSAFDNIDSIAQQIGDTKNSGAVREIFGNERLIYSPYYIKDHLSIKRAGSSDMIELTFTAIHPQVCQQVLSILTDIFIVDFKSLKSKDAENLVSFYVKESQAASQRLNTISEDLKQYRIRNGIINYDEQTKQLTVEEMYMNSEFREEMRRYAAAEASLEDLTHKIGDRSDRITRSQEIIDLRERLTTITSDLMIAQSADPKSSRVEALQKEAGVVRRQLTNTLTELSKLQHSTDGASISMLEQQWVAQYIGVIEGKVRIDVLKERRNEFRQRFNTFAPLGSSLHKYERDIDVAEKEYLELLHSLNMARLRQQNLEASTTISVLDQPQIPFKAEPSKRMLLVIGSLVVGFFFCIGGVVGLELLDRSIRTPERAAIFSRLPVAAVFPDESRLPQTVEKEEALHLIRRQTLRNVQVELLETKRTGPTVITIAGVHTGEGKSHIGTQLATLFAQNGNTVSLLVPHELTIEANDLPVTIHRYEVPKNFTTAASYHELLDTHNANGSDVVLIELPPMQSSEIPIAILRESHLVLFIMRADRIWRRSDSVLLGYLQRNTALPIRGIVNGVQMERLEEYTGELPKRRSTFRRYIKRIAEFRFSSN